ncbi:MAG: sigma-70 family RNA polymerase sigma factor [Planctomycetes bacterium]|nr:sigma-70 family RNA polymerase sigma factor [Planctomycetota bacterium]
MAYFIRLSPDEVDDLQQDLLLDLWKRWPRFDPRRSSSDRFIRRVLRNQIAHFLKRRKSSKSRWRRGIQPLDEVVATDNDEPLKRSDTHADPRDPTGRGAERNLENAETISRLPPKLKRLCELLGRMSISEAAVVLHTDRANIYRDLSAVKRKLMQLNAVKEFRQNT